MGHSLSNLACNRCDSCYEVSGEFQWSSELGQALSALSLARRSHWRAQLDDELVLPGEEEVPAHRRQRNKDRAILDRIISALRANPIFTFLDDSELEQLSATFKYYVFNTGEFVVKEGMTGAYFFVADTDGLDVYLKGGQVASIPAGNTFGELALVARSPRSVSVIATRPDVGVWAADARLFRRAVQASVMLQVSDNRAFLDSVGLLEGLSAREVDCVSDSAAARTYGVGEFPSRRTRETNCVYFVKSGELRLVPANTIVPSEETVFGPGSCIGERVLLYGEPLSMTVEVTKKCELLRVDVRRLRGMLGRDLDPILLQQGLLQSSMKKSGLFSALPQALLVSAVQAMEYREYVPGAKIPDAGCFFVVLDGTVQVGTRPVAKVLQRGQWHGLTGWAAPASPEEQGSEQVVFLAGHSGCRLAMLPTEGASGFRCEDPERIYARMAEVMSKVCVFLHLSKSQIDTLVRGVIRHTYRQGEQVVVQGQHDSHFFIVASGEARTFVNGREVRKLVKHNYFGEHSILFDVPRAATVQVTSVEAEIWALDKDTFMRVVRAQRHLTQQLIHRIWLQDNGIELQNLRRVGKIGCGTSGVVHLVKHQETGFKYALKRVEKVNGKVPQEVKREIEVLIEHDHPFIMRMVKALETPTHVYLLTEHIPGGELHAAIRSISTVLSRWQAMFYTGSMLLMLETLNNSNIVYRDLKPENVMLDEHGYLKLIDFGSAKRLEPCCPRTFTMVGTPHYMAPEVMRGKGYGIEVDVWALGVVLYELVCGYLPFGDHLENTSEVCKAVLAGDLKFPRDVDASGVELIAGLLNPRPHQRLGCGPRGYDEIKQAAFFDMEGVQNEGNFQPGTSFFSLLLARDLPAPIPPVALQPTCNGCDDQDQLGDILDLCDEGFGGKEDASARHKSKQASEQEGVLDAEQTVDCEPEEEGDPEEPERIPAVHSRTPISPPPQAALPLGQDAFGSRGSGSQRR